MKKAKIIIGANFGDEGKGLATDYFANLANQSKESCLVVCHNGGCQKGHTVVTPSGVRHVFHHFGSGCFQNADTYLSKEYIVNPIMFRKEFEELNRKGILTKTYINKDSRLTSPFDMMINQVIEEIRSNNKHGSCGVGIFETVTRDNLINISVSNFFYMNNHKRIELLLNIADNYLIERLKQLGVTAIPIKWVEILSNKEAIIENFIDDFMFMMNEISICNDRIIDNYDHVIFEGAQGLLLDQNNLEYFPHLTPSNTGLINPINIIGDKTCETEVCYVTRTYNTRHGAGKFETECKKSEIADNIVDLTNVPNEFQDSIRYGKIDVDLMFKTIKKDISNAPYKSDRKISLMITHVNETNNKMILKDSHSDIKECKLLMEKHFDIVYLSDGMTNENIK